MSSISPKEILYMKAHIHDDRQQEIIAACVICLVLASTAVILRLLARFMGKVRILADDYMIIATLALVVGQVACVLYCVYLGLGKHVLLLRHMPSYAKTIIAQEVLYCAGTSAFKFSALLLFHRIFGSVKRFTAILWVIGAIIAANNIAEVFLSIFQCTPVHKAWHQAEPGYCVPILPAACIPGSINVITDLIVVLLPIPMIWNLQMRTSRKVQLIGIFLLSGFVVIASTYRTIVVKRLSHKDASWADIDPAIWAVVENAIGIVSASLPTMRPIYTFLVRGHYCSTTEHKHCEKCTRKSQGSSGSGSKGANLGNPMLGRPNEKVPSEVGSVDHGGKVTNFEMC